MKNNYELQYKNLINETIQFGTKRVTRSGVYAYSLMGKSLEHDMSDGFPLLTIRKMPQKSIRVETEFYLKGYTDRSWLQKNGCTFWNNWENKEFEDKDDLGPTYGFEWRNWGKEYLGINKHNGKGIDQIQLLLKEIKENPESKRLIVTQWNPSDVSKFVIPPCPFSFQIIKYENKLNLIFYQRSGDLCLGVPNDFAQHALILHLICLETEYEEGKVIGMFGNVELYENHVLGAKKMLTQDILQLPNILTKNFTSLDNWSYGDTQFLNYSSAEKINFIVNP
jgi:thymidylate synthase